MAREGAMLCYPFTKKRLTTYEKPYYLQPKLDGLRCRIIIGDEIILLSSEGNEITCVPHINKAVEEFWEIVGKTLEFAHLELDGELYSHDLTFQEIVSRAKRTKNLHPHYRDIEFHCFDIILDKKVGMIQKDRIHQLRGIFGTYYEHKRKDISMPTYPPIRLVETFVGFTESETFHQLKRFLKWGYEGMIIRNSTGEYYRKRYVGMMKWKPRKKDDYPIIGWTEEIDKDGFAKDTLGALICTAALASSIAAINKTLISSPACLAGKLIVTVEAAL